MKQKNSEGRRSMHILCRLGLHKWKERYTTDFSSNVVDVERRCVRCGKIEHKVVPKEVR